MEYPFAVVRHHRRYHRQQDDEAKSSGHASSSNATGSARGTDSFIPGRLISYGRRHETQIQSGYHFLLASTAEVSDDKYSTFHAKMTRREVYFMKKFEIVLLAIVIAVIFVQKTLWKIVLRNKLSKIGLIKYLI